MNLAGHQFFFARITKAIPSTIVAVCMAMNAAAAETTGIDTNKIEALTGLKGTFNEAEGVFKITAPRTDVKVTVDNWQMPPFMGLTSWAAFTAGKTEELMVMGDLVLMEDEVNPVMSRALEAGLNVTALHNHFFFDEPKVYFMHIAGEGKVANLSVAVKSLLDKVKEIRSENPKPARSFGGLELPPQNSITAKTIEEILGVQGQSKDGLLKIVIGRKAKMPCGCEVGKEMGVNTWAAFAGSDDHAVVDGDFAVREEELQPVLKALRRSGIQIVAIHHHMIHEEPRYLFVHYWGKGRAKDLTRGLKAALEVQKKVP